jgi:hypothetical protein
MSASSRENRETRAVHGIAVALLFEDPEHLATLRDRMQATRLGREVFSHLGFPISATDTIIRQLQESHAEVVIVELLLQSAESAIRAIELIHATTQIAIFVSGDTIGSDNSEAERLELIKVMARIRNGGVIGYFNRSMADERLLECLARFSATRTLKSTYWDVRKWN